MLLAKRVCAVSGVMGPHDGGSGVIIMDRLTESKCKVLRVMAALNFNLNPTPKP